MNKLKIILVLLLLSVSTTLFGQVKISHNPDTYSDAFPLAVENHMATIYYDKADSKTVRTTANLFADDIKRVTGHRPKVSTGEPRAKDAVIIGTLDSSKIINKLIKKDDIDVSSIRGGWEQYILKTIDNPLPGVEKAIVIIGSGRRGTAYGTLSISKAIGVSPWYWWADVPVKKSKKLYVASLNYVSKEPSVKYRGIFLNDEDWGLLPWASKKMDTALDNIGPKTYARVCELILRLKGNMLAPAMHPVSEAFYQNPKNKKVADKYGIVMTSSHAEPLLYNNASEWNKKKNGPWNYVTNKKGVLHALDKRVAENSPYENVYPVGIRGIHDRAMAAVPKDCTKVDVLEDVISAERNILKKYIDKPIDEIPQVFVAYKEVLNIYDQGMKLPDDITLVWPDDNYGYIKRLSNKKERKRSGESGVYYHISYLGHPHDYLWLNTTPPALIYEEMNKAYHTGANRYWLLNVGDLKPGELGIQFFLSLAWDNDAFNYNNVPEFLPRFLASIFGEKYKADLTKIIHTYYRLGFQRKPEYMDWSFKWNTLFSKGPIMDTDFSFKNYNEAQNRLDQYHKIAVKAKKILQELPKKYKPAFYELVYYPVKGAELQNLKMLQAQKNHWYARQGRSLTNHLAGDVKAYDDSISMITKRYNSLLNGKWEDMMTVPRRRPQLPPLDSIKLADKAKMGIFVQGSQDLTSYHILPRFNPYTDRAYKVVVYDKGKNPISWKAKTNNSWLELSKSKGRTNTQNKIWVSVNWDKAPTGKDVKGKIEISSGSNTEEIYVSVFNPKSPSVKSLKGISVEDNGVVSIYPGNISHKIEKRGSKVHLIKQLGYEGESVQLGKMTDKKGKKATAAEYDFYSFSAGSATIYTYALPLFPKNKNHKTRYGVKIDNGSYTHWMTTGSHDVTEHSFRWQQNVLRNSAVNSTTISIDKPGKHTLKLIAGDPGMIIQKIVIDFGGLKRSYLGPPSTIVK
jgi:hypothetical protein